jgi:hypothetical protein
MTTPPPRPPSSGGAPAGMPSRLWEAAKHGDRGSIPPWVQDAPDAGATAPPHISSAARRAAQVAAVAGAIGGGIGVGMGIGLGASSEPSPATNLSHTDAAPATDHISLEHVSTDHVGSATSSLSGETPGPPGTDSEGVTLHATGHGDHLSSGLHTTWRIPAHSGGGSEHGQHGAEVQHDGLTIEIYQDVVVNQGTDGMYSVDAVEYVVVKDEHGHSYVFSDNYHTVVPDPPGQETDLVIHETDHVQVTEHPDGSFSVNQADNSLSVTVGADGDGGNEVTVTQSETVQIDHGHPNAPADGHDTSSLTENEDGATTSSQTEVVASDAPLPPGQEPAGPAMPGDPQVGLGVVTTTAGGVTATSSGTASATGGTTSASSGMTAGHQPAPPSTFSGLHGGSVDPGHQGAQTGHFPGAPVSPQHPAGGSFDSTSGSAAPKPFAHPATDQTAGTSSPDQHHGTVLAAHDQSSLDDSGSHTVADPVTVEPAEPEHTTDSHSAVGYEAAAVAHPDSLAGSADLPDHDPGTTAIH